MYLSPCLLVKLVMLATTNNNHGLGMGCKLIPPLLLSPRHKASLSPLYFSELIKILSAGIAEIWLLTQKKKWWPHPISLYMFEPTPPSVSSYLPMPKPFCSSTPSLLLSPMSHYLPLFLLLTHPLSCY